jgi:hypothetical protein
MERNCEYSEVVHIRHTRRNNISANHHPSRWKARRQRPTSHASEGKHGLVGGECASGAAPVTTDSANTASLVRRVGVVQSDVNCPLEIRATKLYASSCVLPPIHQHDTTTTQKNTDSVKYVTCHCTCRAVHNVLGL